MKVGHPADALRRLHADLPQYEVVSEDGDRAPGRAVLRGRRGLAALRLGYNMSIGVWVGLIALLGLDAETGIFMLLYLDLAHDERVAAGTLQHASRISTKRSSMVPCSACGRR